MEGDIVNKSEDLQNGFKRCPGIDWTHYQEHYFGVTTCKFYLKSIRLLSGLGEVEALV